MEILHTPELKEVQAGQMGQLVKDADGNVHIIHETKQEDIRVQLSDIRKEIEDTNRTLKRIAEGLERGRR